ncbi:helicase associated domain-containing protein [Streptomyces mirabilis]|uniref:helicase associated domain-containing protein n=1 Tax=Streptomyces mirabilis TaxID=68239 RepID=UPI003317D5F9
MTKAQALATRLPDNACYLHPQDGELAASERAAGVGVPPGPHLVEDSGDLGRWAVAQRQAFTKLTAQQQTLLAALGITRASEELSALRMRWS